LAGAPFEVPTILSPRLALLEEEGFLGPLLDRIDMHIQVAAVRKDDLLGKGVGEASCEIRKRVNGARKIQLKRFQKANLFSNAQMGHRDMEKFSLPQPEAKRS